MSESVLKLAVFTPSYPTQNRVGNYFVKVRVDQYAKLGHEVCVFTYGPSNTSYESDGVLVVMGNAQYLAQKLDGFSFDRFLVHLIDRKIAWYILKRSCYAKCILWIHGFETMAWYRDKLIWKFNAKFLLGRARRAFFNIIEMSMMRLLILAARSKIKYIFVSQWMKRISEADLFCKFQNYRIIPNPINTDVFFYKKKSPDQRLKVWFMRTYDDYKYGADIALDAIREFSTHPYFKEFEFLITGVGQKFEELTHGLHQLPNIQFRKKYMTHAEISQLNTEYGVYLIPTRQDSQGVSMCEAMSSGMVVISSYSTAIPEFLSHEKTGFMTHSPQEIVETFVRLYENPSLFENVSVNAAQWVREHLELNTVSDIEMNEISSHHESKTTHALHRKEKTTIL